MAWPEVRKGSLKGAIYQTLCLESIAAASVDVVGKASGRLFVQGWLQCPDEVQPAEPDDRGGVSYAACVCPNRRESGVHEAMGRIPRAGIQERQ